MKNRGTAEDEFGSERSQLSSGDKAVLGAFAQRLIKQNIWIYLDVRGHADSTGFEDYGMVPANCGPRP